VAVASPEPAPSVPLGVAVRGRVETGDVTVSDLSYALPSGRRVPAYLVRRTADRGRPGPGVVLAHWGRVDGWRVLLNEAIDLARAGHRVVVPEAPRPGGTDPDGLARSVGDAVATSRRALDVLVALAKADAARLGLVGHEGAALPALVLAAADDRVRGLVLDGYGGVGRLTQVDPAACAASGRHRRLLVQHRSGSSADTRAGQEARRVFEAARRPRQWRTYEATHGTDVRVRADRAAFLDEALRGDAADGAAATLQRGARLLRDPDWWLRDRTTGERTLAPEATTPLLLWQLLASVRALGLAPGHERALHRGDLAVGAVWALDELVSGSNPARRAVGAGVLGVQAARAGWAARHAQRR